MHLPFPPQIARPGRRPARRCRCRHGSAQIYPSRRRHSAIAAPPRPVRRHPSRTPPDCQPAPAALAASAHRPRDPRRSRPVIGCSPPPDATTTPSLPRPVPRIDDTAPPPAPDRPPPTSPPSLRSGSRPAAAPPPSSSGMRRDCEQSFNDHGASLRPNAWPPHGSSALVSGPRLVPLGPTSSHDYRRQSPGVASAQNAFGKPARLRMPLAV